LRGKLRKKRALAVKGALHSAFQWTLGLMSYVLLVDSILLQKLIALLPPWTRWTRMDRKDRWVMVVTNTLAVIVLACLSMWTASKRLEILVEFAKWLAELLAR
jgi:hypothetical protein